MDSWANKYVGLPYARKGRSMDGCDCWGLIQIVLREERGIEIPEIGGRTAADMDEGSTAGLADGWAEVALDQLEAFDVLRLNTMVKGRILPFHAGVAVARNLVLHTDAFGVGRSVIEDSSRGGFKWRLIKAYRFTGT